MENRISDLKPLRVKISLPEAQVLMQREGTVLDLKNEIEKTFAKIFPHSSFSKNSIRSIKRDKGKVILPFWHPVEPLLTDDEEVTVEFGSLDITDNVPDQTGMCNNCGCRTFIRNLMENKTSDSTFLDRIASEPSIADQEFAAGNNLESARARKRKVLSPDTTVSDQHHIRVIQTSFEDDLESHENLPSPSKKARGNEKPASKKKRNFFGSTLLGSVDNHDPVKHPADITVPNAEVVSDTIESPVLSDTVILSRASSDITGQSIELADANNRTASFGILNMNVGVEKSPQNAKNISAEENNLKDKNDRVEREKLTSSKEGMADLTVDEKAKSNNSITQSTSKGEMTGRKELGNDLDLSLSMLNEGDMSKPLEVEKEMVETGENKKIANLQKESLGIKQVGRARKVEQSGEDEIIEKDEKYFERKRKKKRKKKDKDLERVASNQSQDTMESEIGSEKRKKKDKDLETVVSSQGQGKVASEFGSEKRRKKDKDLEKIASSQSQGTIESELGSESASYKVISQENKDPKNESVSDLHQDELLSSSFPLVSEEPTNDEHEEFGSHTSGKKKKKKKRKSKEAEIERSFDDSNSQSCDTSTMHTEESSAKQKKKKSKIRSSALFEQFLSDANDVFEEEDEDLKAPKTMAGCDAASKSDTSLFKIPKPKAGNNALKENTEGQKSMASNAGSLHGDNNKQSLKSTKRKQDDESFGGIPGNDKECEVVVSKNEEELCFDDETDAEILAIQSNIKSITDAVHESDYSSTIDLPLEFKKKTRRSKGRRSKSISDKKEVNSELKSVAGVTGNKQSTVAVEQPGKAFENKVDAKASELNSMEIESQNKGKVKKSKSEKAISSHEKYGSLATHSEDNKMASVVPASDSKSKASSRSQAKRTKKETGYENEKKRTAADSCSSETSSISFSDVSGKITPQKSKPVADNSSLTKKKEEHRSKIPGVVEEKEKPGEVADVKSAKTSKEKRSRRRSRSSRSSGFKEACVTKVSAWLSQIPDGDHECPTADGHDERNESQVKISEKSMSNAQNASFTILETKITDEVVKEDEAVPVHGNVNDNRNSRNFSVESKNKDKNKENANPKSDKRDDVKLSHDKTQSTSKGYKDEDTSDDNSEDNAEKSTKNVVEDSTVARGEKITNSKAISSRMKTRASISAISSGRNESAEERETDNTSNSKKITKTMNTRLKSTKEVNASLDNSQLKFDSLLDDGGSVISSNVPAAPARKSVTPGFVQRSISGFLTNADRKRFQNKMKSQTQSKTEE